MPEQLDRKNVLAMKLLHYFITEKNYNPIILQGAENEIWLENMDSDYKIVRIVSNHIINEEQYDFEDDYYKEFKFIMSIVFIFVLCFFGFLVYNMILCYLPKRKKTLLQEDSLIPAKIVNEPKKEEIMIEL